MSKYSSKGPERDAGEKAKGASPTTGSQSRAGMNGGTPSSAKGNGIPNCQPGYSGKKKGK